MNNHVHRTIPYQLVRLVHGLDILSDWLTAGPLRRRMRRTNGKTPWPVVPGAYLVGDRAGSVAICTLTSHKLMAPLAALPGVAIVGRAYTANLGIEKIIANVTDRPTIRFLVLCGRESPFFQVGRALQSLQQHGITPERQIIAAQGYLPQLSHTQPARIEYFRRQVEVLDYTGETEVSRLTAVIQDLVRRNPGPFHDGDLCLGNAIDENTEREFKILQPGGHRQPLAHDPNGFFIVALHREVGDIIVRHYLPDHTPAHIVRGRNAEAILLGLLREGLVSQMSHAGYLGAELTKAETALRLGLDYEQDQPLRFAQSNLAGI